MGKNPQQPRHYRTKVVASTGERFQNLSAAGEFGYQIFNTMYRSLFVATRAGVRFEVPRQSVRVNKDPGVLIRVKVAASPSVNLDVSGLSNDKGTKASTQEATAYIGAIESAAAKALGQASRVCYVDYKIPEEDFDNNGGLLFLQNLDIQLSVLSAANTPHHPYSISGQRDRDAYALRQSKEITTMYGVTIRDKDGYFGNRFLNINGEVYRVPVIRDGQEPDGVYRHVTGRTTGEFTVDRTAVEFFEFEEADKELGLYLTYNEALALGNQADKNKREYEEKANAHRQAELQAKLYQSQADAAFSREKEAMRLHAARREHALRELELAQQALEVALNQREALLRRDILLLKELSEKSSYARRETADLMKTIPMLITSGIALVVAIQKLRSA
jgi:hypothetical protein